MNYADCCRTCLGKKKEMRYIHSTVAIGGEDVRLSDILHDFYNFQVPEELEPPNNICINCVHHLTITHSFKTLVHNSAKTLTENTPLTTCNGDINYDSVDYSDSDYKPEMGQMDEKPLKTYKTKILSKSHRYRSVKNGRTMRKKQTFPEKRLFCVECKAEFNADKALEEHCKNTHPVKNFTGRECEHCPERFEDFKDLVIHRKLHLRPYLCLTCWNGFYQESEFEQHTCQPYQNKKYSGEDKRQCDQCGKSYPPGYIKVHMMTHGTELKYSCKYCPKKFKVANGLNSHVLWNHKRTRNHKCDVCGATFISASAKSSHIRKNHLKETKYACESCTKRFFSKSELARHMLTHTGVKNFHCHLCDKSYQTRYGLNVHLKSHSHANTSVNIITM